MVRGAGIAAGEPLRRSPAAPDAVRPASLLPAHTGRVKLSSLAQKAQARGEGGLSANFLAFGIAILPRDSSFQLSVVDAVFSRHQTPYVLAVTAVWFAAG